MRSAAGNCREKGAPACNQSASQVMPSPQLDPLRALVGLTREEIRWLFRARLCKLSFADFVKEAWPIHHHGTELVWGWYLDAICEHLQAVAEGKISRLLINCPPGMGKSLLVSVYFPAWIWVRTPWTQILACSSADDVVYRDARRMRELIESDWYRDLFSPEWRLNKTQDAKGYYVNTIGGARMSRTTGMRVTGAKCHLALIDDPLDAKDAFTDSKALAGHTRWFDQALRTRLMTARHPIVIVMQRLHERDLSGHVLAKGGWEHLCLPAEYEETNHQTVIKWRDPRKRDKELLFDHLYPRGDLDDLRRDLGTRGFEAQYQQRPSPAAGALFLERWLQYWVELPECDYYLGSWDFAFKKSDDSDHVVGQVWGVRGAHRYLIAQVREKMNPPDMRAAMLEMWRKWPNLRAMVVEAKAAGPSLVRNLRSEIPGIVEVNPQGDSKQGRAAAVTPVWEAGNVFLPHPTAESWVGELFVPELLAFPFGTHDDQVDSMTQALNWIAEQEFQQPWVFTA